MIHMLQQDFFLYIINTVLLTLFSIEVSKDHIYSELGLLGCVLGYFGVVEAQGWGGDAQASSKQVISRVHTRVHERKYTRTCEQFR